MRCSDVEFMLWDHFAGSLTAEQADSLEAHFLSCPRCESRRVLDLPVYRALSGAAPTASKPDLWSGFQARLAAEVSCEAAALALSELVCEPVGDAAWERAIAHTARCETCASELNAYRRALTALDAVAQSTEAPDLWEPFSRRLAQDNARFQPWLQILKGLRGMRESAVVPALAAAALVVSIAFPGLGLKSSSRPGSPERHASSAPTAGVASSTAGEIRSAPATSSPEAVGTSTMVGSVGSDARVAVRRRSSLLRRAPGQSHELVRLARAERSTAYLQDLRVVFASDAAVPPPSPEGNRLDVSFGSATPEPASNPWQGSSSEPDLMSSTTRAIGLLENLANPSFTGTETGAEHDR